MLSWGWTFGLGVVVGVGLGVVLTWFCWLERKARGAQALDLAADFLKRYEEALERERYAKRVAHVGAPSDGIYSEEV